MGHHHVGGGCVGRVAAGVKKESGGLGWVGAGGARVAWAGVCGKAVGVGVCVP